MADKRATREAYGQTLVKMGGEMTDLVVMDADLSGSTKTAEFKKVYPERFFNLGIAEQNLYATAAGMALSGKVVCASTFAMFAAGRAFEIIRNSISYTKANVKICATHAGITVGEDGASHQTFEDIALMRSIPGMVVVNPSDSNSACVLLEKVIKMQGPAYVRLGRAAVPNVYEQNAKLEIGKAHTIIDGDDISIIATGIMVNEALTAAEELKKEGISARVIDMHTIKPIDEKAIIKSASETGGIVTCEEHSIIGGLGSAVCEITSRSYPCRVERVGQLDTFGESGKPQELKEKYNMTATDIVAAVKKILDERQ